MKKVMRFACLVGVFALALTSCKKNEQNASSFKAVTEKFVEESADGSRAYINSNNQMVFEEGDQVMLFNIGDADSDYALYESDTEGASVHFSPVEVNNSLNPNKLNAFYAFYPGETVTPDLARQNRCVFPVAAEQTYRADDSGKPFIPKGAMYMAAKEAVETDLTNVFFEFKNICGIMCLQLTSPSGQTIKKIRVVDNQVNLSGDVELIIPEVDPVRMTNLLNDFDLDNPSYVNTLNEYIRRVGYNVTNSGPSITLNLGNEGVQLSSTVKKFLVVLRPGALKKGCQIQVSKDGENFTTLVNSSRDNMIRPNVIKTFAALQVN